MEDGVSTEFGPRGGGGWRTDPVVTTSDRFARGVQARKEREGEWTFLVSLSSSSTPSLSRPPLRDTR